MTVSLTVTTREGTAVDRKAQVLGIVYGPKQEPVPVAVDRSAFERLYKDAGESTIIVLEGLGEPLEVLIHDVDFEPVKSAIRHVDFYAIERGKEITVTVPLEFVGESPAEKDGAVINKVLHEIEVTCRPSKLPQHIEVDLGALATVDDQIKVSDLVLPDDVTVENNPDDVVALAAAFEEEPEEPTAPVDMDSVAVEGEDTGTADEEPSQKSQES